MITIYAKWIIYGIGFGLLLLLIGLVVLLNRPIPPPPSPPPTYTRRAQPSMEERATATPEQRKATVQALAVVTQPPSPSHRAIMPMTPTATPYRGQSQRDKGWKTFTDPVAGYSIRYPANVFVQSGSSKNKIYDILTLALGNEQGMTIQIEPNPQHLSMEKFLESRAETNRGKWLTRPISPFLAPVKVAGLSAYQLEYQRADYFQLYSGEIYILLPYRAQIYIFSVGGYGHGGVMLSPEGKNRFFQILATFQVIP